MANCTPENVTAKLVGVLESGGVEVDPKCLDKMPDDAQAVYHKTAAQAGAERFNEAPDNETDNHTLKILANRDNEIWYKKFLNDHRNPSGVLGEEIVAPVIQFERQFLTQYGHVLRESRPLYTQGIKEVFKNIDTSDLGGAQQGYFEAWRNFETRGGGLYQAKAPQSILGQMAKNFLGNTLTSLPHVWQGHAITSFFKIASLYPIHAPVGFVKALSKGLLFRIPELEQAGVYGKMVDAHAGIPILKHWKGVVHLLDTPIKNISYYAGEAQGGAEEGFKAVQKITFQPRFGDIPRQLWTSEGRSQIALQNFAIGSMKMYASLWGNVATKPGLEKAGAATSLFLFHAMPFMAGGLVAQAQHKDFTAGGIAAALPQSLIDLLAVINPEAYKHIEKNRTGFSEVTQIRSFHASIGLGWQLATEGWHAAESSINKGRMAYQHHDYKTGGLELGSAVLKTLMSFEGLGPLNDGNFSKAFDIYKNDVEKHHASHIGHDLLEYEFPVLKTPK